MKNKLTLFLTVLLLVAATSVCAIEQVSIQIGNWSSEQVDISGLQVEIDLKTTGLVISATANGVQLAEPFGRLSPILRLN